MTANERTRKKIRISIIDILITVTIIACIAGTFVHYKLYESDNEVVTSDVCYVSVMFYGVDTEISEKLVSGEKLYLNDGGELFGTVSEAVSEDASFYYTNAKNEIVEASDPSRKDVSVTVEVNGELTANGFLANGVEYVASGMEIDLFSAKYSGKGLVFDVQQRSE